MGLITKRCSEHAVRPAIGRLMRFAMTSLLISALSGVAVASEMIVTGVSGFPRANGVSLLMHDRLSERSDPIELETNRSSSVSVLYGESISLQLGPSTKVLVVPASDQRGELIDLVRGELRTVTRRDRSKKRPEIHTPSAVIRPSTTVLHLFVDPVSGDTEATSVESRAWVVSSDPSHKQSSILNTGQQVMIRVGQAPGSIRKQLQDIKGDIMGFVSGRKLREDALAYDMTRDGKIALGQIAMNDVPGTSLPSVASPFPSATGLGWQANTTREFGVCATTLQCSDFKGIPDDPPIAEPMCGPDEIGEHCQ